MTHLDRFQRLFSGLEDAHGQYACPNKGTTTVRRATSKTAWQRHFKGTDAGLGIPPLRRNGTVRFAALDVDDDKTDHAALARRVEDLGLPLVVCRSKSGGAHLYVFLTDDVPADNIRKKLQQWSEALGLANPDGRPIEIFPKQTKLGPGPDQVGNWINLSYYGRDDTTRYAVAPNGEHLNLEHFLAHTEGAVMAIHTGQLEITLGGEAGAAVRRFAVYNDYLLQDLDHPSYYYKSPIRLTEIRPGEL